MVKARAKTKSTASPRELATVADFIRYAVSCFARTKLAFGQGTHDAIEEAILLVAETLGFPVDRIDPFLPARLTAAERRRIFALIEKRIQLRMPAAYLVNCAYLQGLPFYIDQRVIVPRSYLAEIINNDLFRGEASLVDPAAVGSVLDLCTGSACLAILACDVFPNAVIDAVDISAEALQVAQINVKKHNLKDRITLRQGDLFEPVGGARYDIILTNPPYVAAKSLARQPPEFSHEPRLALAGGADGLDVVRRILTEAGAHLNPQGGLLCEVGRGGPILEQDYPKAAFLWLDTTESSGEVFWIPAATLPR